MSPQHSTWARGGDD